MKTIDLDKLEPDPVAAALASSDKEAVTVSGYICAVDKATISISETPDAASYIEYPRSAVIAAFTDEQSSRVTLLIDANARARAISAARAGTLSASARAIGGGAGCGTSCKSLDGSASCCCGVGQRCRSLSNTCICEDATRPLSPATPGFVASMQQAGGTADTPPPSAGSCGGASSSEEALLRKLIQLRAARRSKGLSPSELSASLARMGGGFGGGGGLESVGGWFCRRACDAAFVACAAGCTGITSPLGAAGCALLCEELHDACRDGCPSFQGGFGGFGNAIL